MENRVEVSSPIPDFMEISPRRKVQPGRKSFETGSFDADKKKRIHDMYTTLPRNVVQQTMDFLPSLPEKAAFRHTTKIDVPFNSLVKVTDRQRKITDRNSKMTHDLNIDISHRNKSALKKWKNNKFVITNCSSLSEIRHPNGDIMDDIISIEFDDHFDESIDDKIINGVRRSVLPNKLQNLKFGYFFNHPLNNVTFPDTLEHLSFGYLFNQPIDCHTIHFPTNLKNLSIEGMFNQPIDEIDFNVPITAKDLERILKEKGMSEEEIDSWQQHTSL